jgi:hypothetical protein
MTTETIEEKAQELCQSWLNGNRSHVVAEARGNPALSAYISFYLSKCGKGCAVHFCDRLAILTEEG